MKFARPLKTQGGSSGDGSLPTDPVEIRQHPAYRFNSIGLHLGTYAALIGAAGVALAYDGTAGWILGATDVCLALLFFACRHYLLPRVRTPNQLDLVVAAYMVPVFGIQLLSLSLAPQAESPAGVACLIIMVGLLCYSTAGFLLISIWAAAAWLFVRQQIGAEASSRDIIHLFLTAPACAIVVRLSVRHIFRVLVRSERRERETVEELSRTVAELRREQELREDSELRFYEIQKNQSLGLMAGGIAHDFNNVLQAINTFAEVIQLTTTDADSRRSATEIRKAAANATDICRQMLVYSGKPQGQRQPVDMAELTQDLTRLLQASIPDNVQLTISSKAATALTINANPGQIRQVIMNLVSNGAEATQPDGGRVSVEVRPATIVHESENVRGVLTGMHAQTGRYVVLQVSDDGCGMDDDTLSRVFDPYFSTKPSGHGFGLSVVQGIVRSHNGIVQVDSQPGQGTDVTVWFSQLSGVRPVDSSQSDQAAKTASAAKAGRILIVDDETCVRQSLAAMLSAMQWDVESADSAAAAQELLRQDQRFDVLLVDHSMPGQNGVTLARQLRAAGLAVPIVLCSGVVGESEAEEICGEPELISAYLLKPFPRSALEAVLQRVLEPAATE